MAPYQKLWQLDSDLWVMRPMAAIRDLRGEVRGQRSQVRGGPPFETAVALGIRSVRGLVLRGLAEAMQA
eukprot:14572542-Heterocapsa_arctica.AAC.1